MNLPKFIILWTVSAFIVYLPNTVLGETYYLDAVNGNDGNPGTSDQPWKTMTKVQAAAQANDTIIISNVHKETFTDNWPDGITYQASGITQFGITWTFDRDYTIGQFTNGDYWIVGPFTIISIDPPSNDLDGRIMHGSMVNPDPGYRAPQGWDSSIQYYDEMLNVARPNGQPVSESNPLIIQPASSLVSAISSEDPSSGSQLKTAAILTVLDNTAPEGSFRPHYAGTDKAIKFNKNQLDYSLLSNLTVPPKAEAIFPSWHYPYDDVYEYLDKVETYFERPWVDHQTGWSGQFIMPEENMKHYGRDISTQVSQGALLLHLAFTNAQKEKLLTGMVQVGIDLYGLVQNGLRWPPDGGHGSGRKWPILFAGIMLDDTQMKGIGQRSGDHLYDDGHGPGNPPSDYVYFGEDAQTFYITQEDVDRERAESKTPYQEGDIGIPEWGIRHASLPSHDSRDWGASYRGMHNVHSWGGFLLAAHIMEEKAQAKTLWNNDALFDYIDRDRDIRGLYEKMFPPIMWGVYRNDYGCVWTRDDPSDILSTGENPCWSDTVRPLAPTNLVSGAQTESSISLAWTAPSAASDGDLASRYRVLRNGTLVKTISDTSLLDTNLSPGTSYNYEVYSMDDAGRRSSSAATGTFSTTDSSGGLTLNISAENGTVVQTPDKPSYAHGEVVALEAIPNTGYHFLNWTGDASGSDSLTAITMNNNKEVVATFAINIYTLDITTVGGSVVKTPDKASYDHGETVTLRAIPDTGYSFLSWSGDLSGSNNPATLTMNTDKSIAANFTVVNPDETAPSISNCSPAPGSIQVPLNNLMTLDATDDNTGIDPDSIVIKINDEIIYSGNQAEYTSIHGTCRRSGTNANYKFVYQPENPFDFDQVVAVSVTASDIAGNTLNQYAYSFKTEMRSFGKNIKVNSDTEAPDKGGVVTAADAEGNIWIVWHAGLDDERDIYISKLTAGTEYFEDSIRIKHNEYDQCNPALAVGTDGTLYVMWQDNRRGNWDIYASVSSDGVEWSNEQRITDSNDNQINPDIAVDNQSPNRAYAVWQDDGAGNYDIYITSSNNGFITETTSRITSNNTNQTEPAIAVGPGNVVYVVWIDYRNGRTDIYGASSDYSTWTNVPVVSNPANQSSPALACEPGTSVLHLLWMDDSGGNTDIYHAMTNGLPDSSLTGTSIIDDTSGADQLEPTIIATSDMQDRTKIFACWQDKRYVTGHSSDTDIFFAELSHGYAGTNILIGDDRTNSNQVGPAIGTDRYCQPYIVWIDDRDDLPGVYCAGTTYMSPIPTVSTDVSALSGAIVGTDPSAIRDIGDVCVVIPPRAYPTDVKITITEIQNPPAFSVQCLSAYDFGPSGIEFSQPVRVIIPYNVPNFSRSASAYWYNSLTTALSQQGITDIEDIIISSTIHALSFRTTHFTPFYVVSGDDSGGGDSGGGGGGGCAISPISEVTFTQFILPYAGLAAVVVILKLRDRRNRKNNRAIRDGY